jgi:hypothetical protein
MKMRIENSKQHCPETKALSRWTVVNHGKIIEIGWIYSLVDT